MNTTDFAANEACQGRVLFIEDPMSIIFMILYGKENAGPSIVKC